MLEGLNQSPGRLSNNETPISEFKLFSLSPEVAAMKHAWTIPTVIAALAVLACVWVVVARPALAEDKPTTPAVATTAAANPIVAAFPYRYDTEYEPDPFETTRLRRARTEVSYTLLVHADGTQEIKPCK
jgi:hypothetical protein